jgi:hypothetical protein
MVYFQKQIIIYVLQMVSPDQLWILTPSKIIVFKKDRHLAHR